jgi:hypothetical protein
MKNTLKQLGIIALLIALLFVLSVCKDPEPDPEQPEFRSEEIIFTFTNNLGTDIGALCKAKVEGTLLAKDWNGSVNKVKTLIENTRQNLSGLYAAAFGNPFRENNNAVIVLEKNPTDGYSKYKIEEDNYQTLYLNIDALNNTDPTKPSLTENDLIQASGAMRTYNAKME